MDRVHFELRLAAGGAGGPARGGGSGGREEGAGGGPAIEGAAAGHVGLRAEAGCMHGLLSWILRYACADRTIGPMGPIGPIGQLPRTSSRIRESLADYCTQTSSF